VIGRMYERFARRLFHLYWRMARGMTLGVQGLVIDGDGRIFLVKHSYVNGWHLPGGGVEPGETLVEALARELREEGNIEVAASPVLHGMFHNRAVSRRDHVAVFVVRAFRQDRPPQRNYEIIDHGFFPADALPADTTSGARARIAEVLHGKPVTQLWSSG
jgi:8-oxo-dGTP pyrophosphatase MutT (NUDIX family)